MLQEDLMHATIKASLMSEYKKLRSMTQSPNRLGELNQLKLMFHS